MKNGALNWNKLSTMRTIICVRQHKDREYLENVQPDFSNIQQHAPGGSVKIENYKREAYQ